MTVGYSGSSAGRTLTVGNGTQTDKIALYGLPPSRFAVTAMTAPISSTRRSVAPPTLTSSHA